MKYLTKEWYETMQRTDLHLLLKPSEEARTFSEDLFRRLYAKAEQEYLDFQKRVCNENPIALVQKFEDTPPPTQRIDGTPTTEAEQKSLATIQQALAIALRSVPKRIHDPDKAMAQYKERFNSTLNHISEIIPPEIQQKIADIRVFALNYATPEIIEEITSYCLANDQFYKKVLKEFRQQQEYLFPDGAPAFDQEFDWHDYYIKTSLFSGSDLVLEPLYPLCANYIFKNAEILLQEDTLENCHGLYAEIYPTASGYEFHLLLGRSSKEGEKLFELILRCTDVIIANP